MSTLPSNWKSFDKKNKPQRRNIEGEKKNKGRTCIEIDGMEMVGVVSLVTHFAFVFYCKMYSP